MTNETPERQGGAWIGQHPDENTEKVRENLPESAERVAVTNNESDERDPRKVDSPMGPPPDEGLVYDPEMTDVDEANVPPDSHADPATPGGEGDSEQD